MALSSRAILLAVVTSTLPKASCCSSSLRASPLAASSVKRCNPLEYDDGKCTGDGLSNCTSAFLQAIRDCAEHGVGEQPELFVPAGKTLLSGPVTFAGSAWAGGVLRVEGTILAVPMGPGWPAFTSELCFVRISDTQNFEVTGRGTIDGQGAAWWEMARKNPHTPSVSKARPPLVGIASVAGLRVNSITLQNSPRFHLPLSNCSNVTIEGITIWSPRDAPNTDGVDLGGVTSAVVRNNHIVNGDDNVAVGSGSMDVLIEHNYFENGHGTSIGSLGFDFTVAHVSKVLVQHNVYNRTSNVARIKTWQGGRGECHNITYQNLTLIDVNNAILIDQYYCPGSQKHPDGQTHCKNYSSAVKVSGVVFKHIVGTHGDSTAGRFACSDTVPCEFQMLDVNLSRNDGGEQQWECWSARGIMTNVVPKPCHMTELEPVAQSYATSIQ